MAFRLRRISHSATGKEIAREARVEGDRLSFGRDPACDLHLTDLAVALRHGTIERKGPGLEIAAAEGVFVEIDGRMVPSGTVPLASGGTVRIASHVLEIAPAAPDADEIEIVVTQAGAAGEAAEPADARSFSLAATRLSKRPAAWALAVLVLAVFLAWPIWSFYQRQEAREDYARAFNADRLWLSGSLSRAHAALRDDCQACHVEPFVAVRDSACLGCHAPGRGHGQTPPPPEIRNHADIALLREARPAPSGWGRVQRAFQDAFNLPRERCADCHTEHEGPQEMPPTAQAFCTECHAGLRSRLPRTELADASDFRAPRAGSERPHPEFRPLVQIAWQEGAPAPRMARVPLDGDAGEATFLRFPHELHLRPRGSVAQMGRRLAAAHGFGASLECADCHVPTPDGVRFQPVTMEGDCRMCHSLTFDRVDGVARTLRHGEPQQVVADLREFYRGRGPARPAELGEAARRRPGDISQIRAAIQFARARAGAGARADQAIRSVFEPNGACYACHQVVAPRDGSLAYRIRPVVFQPRYMFNGWFDHRAHRIVQVPGRPALTGSDACAFCHTRASESRAATDLMIPDQASCTACHGGERSNAAVPSGCAMCHDYHMDEGQPAMLLRRQPRGRRWETEVIRVPHEAGGR